MVDPVFAKREDAQLVPTGLEGLLARWRLALAEDVILDPTRAPAFMGPETFVASQTGGHPATERLVGQAVLASAARSIALVNQPGDARPAILVETSVDGWGETDFASLRTGAAREVSDNPGPLPLVVVAEKSPPQAAAEVDTAPAGSDTDGDAPDQQTEPDAAPGPASDAGLEDATAAAAIADAASRAGRLAVIGDADIAANLLIDSASNRALVINLVAWLLDEERSLGVPPKDRQLTRLLMTREQTIGLGLVATVGIPLFAVCVGLLTWWQRRRR